MSKILEQIKEEHPDVLLMDGFDDCIIGICNRMGQEPIVAYDYHMVINKLASEPDMSYEDAIEYYEFNQIGAWVGERTPCFVEVYEKN